MPRRRPFDLDTLAKLKPRTKRFEYRDPSTPGLVLRLSPTGARHFYWTRRVGADVERVQIGLLADFRLIEDVRKIAGKLNTMRAGGASPAALRRAVREELTFSELWEKYHEEVGQHRYASNTNENRWKKHLAAWGKRRLSSVGDADVRDLLRSIETRSGKVQRNRVRSLLRVVMVWAVEKGYAATNPVLSTRKLTETPRNRPFTAAELRSFWTKLEGHSVDDFKDWVKLALFTGARPGTVYSMRWDAIDFGRRLWTIAKLTTKSKKADLPVPLAGEAVVILRERRRLAVPGAVFVFPSQRKAIGHKRDFREYFNATMTAAGLTGRRPYDLRSTFVSFGANSGVPEEVMQGIIGHTRRSVMERHYLTIQAELLAIATQKTVKAILRAATAKEDENVLPFELPAWAREAQ